MRDEVTIHPTEIVNISDLHPHPRNYNAHPDDQVIEIGASLQKHGVYRNVVIAKDGTILAGHGVIKTAAAKGMKQFPVVRLPIEPDSIAALQVLTGDNGLPHLGEVDDRALTEILKKLYEDDAANLLGTGYDEAMFANLVMVTRDAKEIANYNEAAEWVGLPSYEMGEATLKLQVHFRNESDRDDFAELLGIELKPKTATIWYPPKETDDVASLYFDGVAENE